MSTLTMIPTFPVRRFSVEEYHRMIRARILMEDDAVELLDGWIVPKMSRNPPHDAALDQFQEMIREVLPGSWRVRVQSAITTEDSEPEPDIAVVPGLASRYRDHHPSPEEVALVVEVAESSLERDREVKLPIYARAGIPVYWIVNLPEQQVEVHTQPSGDRYQDRQIYHTGAEVPVAIAGQVVGSISLNDVFA